MRSDGTRSAHYCCSLGRAPGELDDALMGSDLAEAALPLSFSDDHFPLVAIFLCKNIEKSHFNILIFV